MQIGEFFIKLGVDADMPTVKEFAKAIGDLPLDVAAGIASLADLSLNLKDMAQDAIQASIGFQQFTGATGLSAQQLQIWQIAASRMNIPVEAVTSSIVGLQQTISGLLVTGQGTGIFGALGINTRGGPFSVLLQLADVAKRYKDVGILQRMLAGTGISPQLITLLRSLDTGELDRIRRSGLLETKEEEKAALDVVNAFELLREQTKKYGYELVQTFRGPAISAIKFFASDLYVINDITKSIVEMFRQMPALLYVASAAAAALVAYFSPITALVAGVMFLLNDYNKWKHGLPSEGGDFYGQLQKNAPKNQIGSILPQTGAGFGMPFWLPSAQSLATANQGYAGILSQIISGITHQVNIDVHSNAPVGHLAAEMLNLSTGVSQDNDRQTAERMKKSLSTGTSINGTK